MSKIPSQLFASIIVSTSGITLVESIRFVVSVRGLCHAKRGDELNRNLATNLITPTVNRNDLLDVKCTARHADLVERADLLREVLADILVLVADHVGRFYGETYCGAEGTGNKERRRR